MQCPNSKLRINAGYVVVISIFSLQTQRTQIFPVISPESGSEAYFTPGHPHTEYWISHWFSRNSISHFSEGQINRLQRNNQQTQTQDPGLSPGITMAQHRHQNWPHFLGTPHNPHLASRIGNTHSHTLLEMTSTMDILRQDRINIPTPPLG